MLVRYMIKFPSRKTRDIWNAFQILEYTLERNILNRASGVLYFYGLNSASQGSRASWVNPCAYFTFTFWLCAYMQRLRSIWRLTALLNWRDSIRNNLYIIICWSISVVKQSKWEYANTHSVSYELIFSSLYDSICLYRNRH